MSDRDTPRLAYFGEYFPADPENNEVVYNARLQLIEASKRVFPTFLEELSTRVFPLYEALAKSGYDFDRIVWHRSPYELLTDDGNLKQALSTWATGFNAHAEWLIVGALRTLRGWYCEPEWRTRFRWESLCAHSGIPVVSDDFEFRYHSWDVQSLSWADYRRGLRAAVEQTAAEYERKARETAVAHGLVRARLKYSPVNLEWFVLYQFAGKSSRKIADLTDNAADESTVLKGIKAAAELVGWDHLRQRGRTTGK
jgi:hypothetical protein